MKKLNTEKETNRKRKKNLPSEENGCQPAQPTNQQNTQPTDLSPKHSSHLEENELEEVGEEKTMRRRMAE